MAKPDREKSKGFRQSAGACVHPQFAAWPRGFKLDLNKKFKEYSKGNKQKVGLVQAFMHKPRLLILEQPTAGLDPLNQQEFFEIVAEARGDGAAVSFSLARASE